MPPNSCLAPNTSQSSTPGLDLVTSMSPMVRRMAKGSLTPDSISRMPASRFGIGVRRTTSNTTAASVEATTAPMMRAVSHPVSKRSCQPGGDDPGSDQDPDVGQDETRDARLPQDGRLGGEAALEEDDHQGDDADVPDHRHVADFDQPEDVASEEDADPEREKGCGHPEPIGSSDDEDSDDHEPGRDEQDTLDRQMIKRHVVGAWSMDMSTLRMSRGTAREPRISAMNAPP